MLCGSGHVSRACSSWHLLLDVGSTTTDLIPLNDRGPTTSSRTDWHRLLRGELLYLGARRTPLCALLRPLPARDSVLFPAAEFFADIYDAFLILGLQPERPDYQLTADGRPATLPAARQRLARMLCADACELEEKDLVGIAQAALAEWQHRFCKVWQRSIQRFGRPPRSIVLAGEGEWLARRCLRHVGYTGSLISLAEQLGPALSQAACAFAVAWLRAQSLHSQTLTFATINACPSPTPSLPEARRQ
ncbi:hypothetical protein HRbin36_02865 [bacterium HR36]|nr:hypothetical protein HRbin36_02865 [bacterium HR36]